LLGLPEVFVPDARRVANGPPQKRVHLFVIADAGGRIVNVGHEIVTGPVVVVHVSTKRFGCSALARSGEQGICTLECILDLDASVGELPSPTRVVGQREQQAVVLALERRRQRARCGGRLLTVLYGRVHDAGDAPEGPRAPRAGRRRHRDEQNPGHEEAAAQTDGLHVSP
jgi:hypothetical protein